ncbi:MAG TPA: hypothetical protein RMH99_00295 [Sandaracinaceae bacterium LLY-WYZ-13_1]|nr:hypothetical protein [Sandaracinaceae bacterium LLY-WYZ-13_1]
MRRLFLSSLLLLAACDGGDDADAGLDAGPRPDAGLYDAGVDAGLDAGPEPTFRVRLVHDVPGMTGTEEAPGSAHVCAWLYNGERRVPLPPNFLTRSTGPIPFRGVSPYVPFAVVDPLAYRLGVYEPTDVAEGCPEDPLASGAPSPVLLEDLEADQVPADSVSSVVLTGLLEGTLGADGGALPSVCDPTPDPAPFDEACPGGLAARMIVVSDDPSEPAEGMAKLRFAQQIPNIAPVGFNLCYEPSLAPDPEGPPGTCIDTVPDDTPSTLFADVGYGEVTAYAERAPITPTVPSMGFGGAFFLVPETGGVGCPPFTALPESSQRCLPVLAAFPTPPPSDNIRPQLEAGQVTTLFATGLLGLAGDDAEAFGSSLFLWQDDYVAE